MMTGYLATWLAIASSPGLCPTSTTKTLRAFLPLVLVRDKIGCCVRCNDNHLAIWVFPLVSSCLLPWATVLYPWFVDRLVHVRIAFFRNSAACNFALCFSCWLFLFWLSNSSDFRVGWTHDCYLLLIFLGPRFLVLGIAELRIGWQIGLASRNSFVRDYIAVLSLLDQQIRCLSLWFL